MSLKDQLNQDLKAAMKNKDAVRRNTLRSLQAAIKQVEIDKQQTMDDAAVLKVLMAEAKRRREAIDAYEQGGRSEDASAEQEELAIIEAYLPEQMSRDEVAKIVQATIAEVGATSPKDIGKVMPVVMGKLKGKADGRLVNEVVREQLSGD